MSADNSCGEPPWWENQIRRQGLRDRSVEEESQLEQMTQAATNELALRVQREQEMQLEEELRNKHPALRDAWDKYRTMLELVRGK